MLQHSLYTFDQPKFPDYVATYILEPDYELHTFWTTDDILNPRIFEFIGKNGMYLCFREVAVKKVGKYFGPIKKKYLDANRHVLDGTISHDGVAVYDDVAEEQIYLRPLIRYRKIDGMDPSKRFSNWKRGVVVEFIDADKNVTDVFKIVSRTGNVVTMKRNGDNQLAVCEIQPNFGDGMVMWTHTGVTKRGFLSK